jgi:hypothetical protein
MFLVSQRSGVLFSLTVIYGARMMPNSHTRQIVSNHNGQKRILLGSVETVDLVHKQKRALTRGAPSARGFKHFFQVGNAGENRRDRFEMKRCFIREQSRRRRLA